jgi:5S rRNA maturation endonuclease (ribonuclease M5)
VDNSYSKYIINALKTLSKRRKVIFSNDNKFAKIQCINPAHKGGNESDPSLRINIEKNGRYRIGSSHCFACGISFKTWKHFAIALDRPDLIPNADAQARYDEIIEDFFDETDKFVADDTEIIQNKLETTPWLEFEDWRGINGKLLTTLGAKILFEEIEEFGNTMLYFDCVVNNSVVGGIKANIKKRGKNNYFFTSGEWIKSLGLFPYDYVKNMIKRKKISTLVLTEGARDSLNSIQNSIPAACILGSNNWNDIKADLVTSLPIKRVITAFDPDEAGDNAKQLVYNSLKYEVEVVNFDLYKWENRLKEEEKLKEEDKLDLGNAPRVVFDALRKHII